MTELTLTLVAFLFPLAYSPGPGNLFFAANGARFGWRATVRANAGYHVATWLVTVALGFGFAAASVAAPEVFRAVQVAGSLYVLYLASNFFRAGRLEGGRAARPAGFVDGAALLVLNPKAYVIIALMFSQFLVATDLGRVATVVLIATVFTANNLVAFLLWTAAGDALARRFRDDRNARRLNVLFGVLLIAVAVWMLLG